MDIQTRQIIYCQPTIFDVSVITEMWEALVYEELSEFIIADAEEQERYALAMTLFMQNPGHIIVVAKDGKDVIGYTHAYIFNQPYGKPRCIAFSESSYVKPEYRADGIGMRLVEECRTVIKERGIQVDCEEFSIPYNQRHIDSWAKRKWHPVRAIMRRR